VNIVNGSGSGLCFEQKKELNRRFTAYDLDFDINI
jgi:hypothetical protein